MQAPPANTFTAPLATMAVLAPASARHLGVSRLSSRLSSRRDTTTDCEDGAEDDELELEFALITAMAANGDVSDMEDEASDDLEVAPGLRSSVDMSLLAPNTSAPVLAAGVTLFVTEDSEDEGAQPPPTHRLGVSRLSSRLTSRRATTTDTEDSDHELDEMELEFSMLLADTAATTAAAATTTTSPAPPATSRLHVSRLSSRRETTTDCSESESEADDSEMAGILGGGSRALSRSSTEGFELEQFDFDIESMRPLCSSDEEQLDLEDPFAIRRRLCGRGGRRAAVDLGGSTGNGGNAAVEVEEAPATAPEPATAHALGSTRLSRRITSSGVNDSAAVDMAAIDGAYDADSGDSDNENTTLAGFFVAAAVSATTPAVRVAFPTKEQQPRRRRKHSGLRRVALKQGFLAKAKKTIADTVATESDVDNHTAFRRRNNSDEVKAKQAIGANSVINCTPAYTISEADTVVIPGGVYTLV